ncbi:MAG: HAMP domain-containing histidine kinase [Thermodesulfobacteria bacterium]|nr:HAMP domain-containing histidine kinase [Thermodesulfobacteriota bacterium]
MKVSLRLKVVIIFVLIELLMVGAIGTLYTIKATSMLESEFIAKGKAIAQFFANTIKLPILSGNKEKLEEQCERMLERPDISEVKIFDGQGHLLTSCSLGQTGDSELVSFPVTILRDTSEDVEGIYNIAPEKAKETIGKVYLYLSRKKIDQKIWNLQLYALGICLGALAISVLIGTLIVGKMVVDPILKLKNEVERFSQGLLDSRVELETNDELEELANTFNHMAESLKGYISDQIDKATDKVQLKNLAVLGELSAMLLHEVGNTLNRFGLIKYQLSQERLSEAGEKAIETFDENLGSLKRFTQNVSLFSKKPEVVLKRINIKELIQALCSSLKLIDKKGISIDTRLPEDDCFIMGDKELINQAILNILTNAMDAVGPRGKIELELRKLDDRIQISISDNGRGIPPAEIGEIFRPFFTKKGPRGTGLGLAIAKSFIEAHEGTIDVKSRPGRTQFIITIPTHMPVSVSE